MAKRGRKTSRTIVQTAETIGSTLGRLAAKVDAWRGQRQQITDELTDLISSAQKMLREVRREPHSGRIASLGEIAHTVKRRQKGGRPRGYKMSAATKAKLRAAWKRRKAARAE